MSAFSKVNPRAVPVSSVDRHLPAVPTSALQIQSLRARFLASPKWMPELSAEIKFSDREPLRAAVLIPILMRERPTVLLTQRAQHLSVHPGQIAFPGGKVDPLELDPVTTALREAWEEVGLPKDKSEVLGCLPTYTTGTAFVVTPVVALIQPDFLIRTNPDEVAEAFEVPLDFLMNPAKHRRHVLEQDGVRREWFSMPWFDEQLEERYIWGATAGMIRNLYRFLIA